MSNLYRRYFPAPGDLRIAVEAHRDGSAVELQNGVPIFAKYYLIDEFDTPVLDQSCNWFASPNEAVFVAQIYARLVDENHPAADRMFHSAYVRYMRSVRRLPEVMLLIEKEIALMAPRQVTPIVLSMILEKLLDE